MPNHSREVSDLMELFYRSKSLHEDLYRNIERLHGSSRREAILNIHKMVRAAKG